MVDLSTRADCRPDPVIDGLKKLLSDHIDKRIVVVGTTCTGKSTLISQIPGARDQDAKNMQAQILTEVKSSGIPWMEYSVG